MRSPALAIPWGILQRHRWGLGAIILYLLALGTARVFILGSGRPGEVLDSERFAFTVIVPLSASFMYLLVAFSLGLSGDLGARPSMYPARMFTLPVTSAALAGWPMLFGTAAMAGVWMATTLLGLWPSGINVPLVWPALFVAALMAWTQVLMWMGYGLPGLRVIAAVVLLVAISMIAILAMIFKPPELLMVAILAPQLPLAYFIARAAVSRARCGIVPDWQEKFEQPVQAVSGPAQQRNHFSSPASAQAWLEWRQNGRSLPVWVGVLLPFEFAFLLFGGSDAPAIVFYVLLGALLTPTFMAAFTSAALRRPDSQANDGHELSLFGATRPLTSAALVAAKLKVAMWSTLATWLLIFIAIPLALLLTDTWPVVTKQARQFAGGVGTPRAVVLALLVLSLLVASTWKQLAQSLYIGMSGRQWLIRTTMFLAVCLLIVIVPTVQWLSGKYETQGAVLEAVPWILAVLAVLKIVAAGWVATRLHQRRLMADRALIVGAAVWLTSVLALYGVLLWVFGTPHFPRYLLLLFAILVIPLARLSAAPLALAWNRHR